MITEGISTMTNNLASAHIGLALEYLYESRKVNAWNKKCLSSIIHGFIGLESYVNFLGHELLFNEDSKMFLAINRKELPVKKLLNSWSSNLSVLDKIDYILSLQSISMEDNMKSKLMELNNFRNWLIHGFSYKTTYLAEQDNSKENTYSVIDSEDNVDWKSKFPNMKFNSLIRINHEDAEKAMKIILECLKILIKVYRHPILLINCIDKIQVKVISHEDENDIHELLEGDSKR